MDSHGLSKLRFRFKKRILELDIQRPKDDSISIWVVKFEIQIQKVDTRVRDSDGIR